MNPKPIPLPTSEEFTLILRSIHLPLAAAVLEKQRAALAESTYALKSLYIAATDAVIDRVLADISAVKRDLRLRKIKVWAIEEGGKRSYRYAYVCNGYEHSINLMREKVRVDVGVLLAE